MNALDIANVVLPALAAVAVSLDLTVTRRGGLTFFRIGRLGGSFYWARVQS